MLGQDAGKGVHGMTRGHLWLALSLAALISATGCSTMSSFWPSGWFGSNSSPQANLAQHNARNSTPANPSRQGANAQLGAPAAAAAGPFAAMSASFKKWTGSEQQPPPQDDALSLDTKPKQLSAELCVQIAHMHEAKGDFATAIKQYEEALKSAPNNTELLVQLGRAHDRNGDMPKAIATYQQAIKLDARCALAHNDLGLCYARQNDLARARESLNKAVSLVPTSKLYRNNLATVLVSARQYNDAYEQLTAVHPPAIAQYNLGILANRRGDKTEAISRFQQAASLDPNLAQARNMIDKLNGLPVGAVAGRTPAEQGSAAPGVTPPAIKQIQTDVADQARQYQQNWRDNARQMQSDWKQQGQTQVNQLKTQANQAKAEVADRVQSQAQGAAAQANQGVNQSTEAAQAAIREAEAKIRAALQPQVAPIDPGYSSGWVPPQTDDVTPIQGEADTTGDDDASYSISDEDESPILLPPTGE
jgi:Tfp pilus assembly protein PilF